MAHRSINFADNYFSIDDILATQERIPCVFDHQVFNLGYLDPASQSDHIVVGTKLELPFWMARSLAGRRRQFVSIELPKTYKEGYREILKADPTVVDLHKLGPYFYKFGSQLLQFGHTDGSDIAQSLIQCFQGRFRKIMDSAQNAYHEDASILTAKLDEAERIIFECGQMGLKDFQRWETRQTEKLTTSEMVINHRKRKRAQMETN